LGEGKGESEGSNLLAGWSRTGYRRVELLEGESSLACWEERGGNRGNGKEMIWRECGRDVECGRNIYIYVCFY
jgi:hypothetical protein